MFYPYFPMPPEEWWEMSSQNLRFMMETSEEMQRRAILINEAMVGKRPWTDKELLSLWQEKGLAGMLAWNKMLPFHLEDAKPWSDLIAMSNMCLPTHKRPKKAPAHRAKKTPAPKKTPHKKTHPLHHR